MAVSLVSRWPLTAGPEFYHRAVHVGLMIGKRVLWQVSLPVLLLPPVSIIPPLLHLNFIYILLLPEGQTVEVWEPTKKQ